MGAAISYIIFACVGGAFAVVDHPSIERVTSVFRNQSTSLKTKLFGVLFVIGIILFFVVRSKCGGSVDYCKNFSFGKWLWTVFGGFILGFGYVGLVDAVASAPSSAPAGPSYTSMHTQPSISMT